MRLPLIFVAGLFAALGPSLAAAQTLTDQQITDEMAKMHWTRGPANATLPMSKSLLALPDGYVLVTGAEAQRFEFLNGGPNDTTIEAVALKSDVTERIIYVYVADGFVSADDWGDVDATALLQAVTENTAKANEERRKRNIDEVHVTGWIQKPTFDSKSETAFWAIGASTGSSPGVNSIALRLGRYGYEKLTWVVTAAGYKAVGGGLDLMLRAHSFAPGAQYSEHVSTDKVAGYTLASLVAVVAGAKLAKVAGIGALLLLLKKFGIVIVSAGVGVLAWIKSLLSRKPKSS